YLSAAMYTRESVKELEKKRIEEYINQLEIDIATMSSEMASKGNVGPEMQALMTQQQALLDKLRKIEHVGRVVIDFENEENYKNLQIEDGDMFYVPKNNSTVSVIGEVFNPATFVLDTRFPSVRNYVELAGGCKENANKKDIYVIKANGSVRTRKMVRISKYSLESGDAVVVPRKIPYNTGKFKMFMDTLEAISRLSAIALTTVSTIALIKAIKKD
ncbi:MAG: capsule biosynthesis GfcC family protein, partial [Deltaproteobacteria bacterium]|nr:capsule biosynthesis GfcC family protein [Deltaproteobacteria bacterium]